MPSTPSQAAQCPEWPAQSGRTGVHGTQHAERRRWVRGRGRGRRLLTHGRGETIGRRGHDQDVAPRAPRLYIARPRHRVVAR